MFGSQIKNKAVFLVQVLQYGLPKNIPLRNGHVRQIHQSSCLCGRFYESHPKAEYQDEDFENEGYKKRRENWFGIKDGLKDLRGEIRKWKNEWHERLTDEGKTWILSGDIDYVWKFDSPAKLETWTAISDRNHDEGFSRCELVTSPTGKALFQGFVNTHAPQDGRVKYAGYCSMKSQRVMKSFGRESYMDWESFTHLLLRVRGDGRSYIINISTAGYFDITWNDVYHYVLHTRGGPYWQDVRIPFSKFILGSKGRVQDRQDRIPLTRVASFGLAVGKVDGPFSLEIDHIGIECDWYNEEEFAYEMYKLPKYIAGV